MRLAITVSFLWPALSSATVWPDCYKVGEDWNGHDVISGHRFSPLGCSHWCKGVPQCVRWVYKEDGQMCHIKADEGVKRDANNPLLPEDRTELGINHTNPIPATTPSPPATLDPFLDVKLLKRVDELSRTYSGNSTCYSDAMREL